jgi:hypothetical protein
MSEHIDADTDKLRKLLPRMNLSVKNRLAVMRCIEDCEKTGASKATETLDFGALAVVVTELLNARQWFGAGGAAQNEPEALHTDMLRRIRAETKDLSDELVIETAHALLRHYAEGGETEKGVYNDWHRYVKSNLSSLVR